jgi:hypothetical protein
MFWHTSNESRRNLIVGADGDLTETRQAAGQQEVALTMAVIFSQGSCSLDERETATLRQWVYAWRNLPAKYQLLLGGACETSRAGRLRRLTWLTHSLDLFGISLKRIHPDEDWLRPTRMGSLDNLPSDIVWLQLRKAVDLIRDQSKMKPRAASGHQCG